MTLVVCWRSTEKIFCVADTRISAGGQKLMDSAAKVFSVPIIISFIDEQSSQIKSKEAYSLGFAFAGNTLVATNVHSASATCTQMLSSFVKCEAPSARAIAELYAKIATQVVRELTFISPKQDWSFMGFLFGFCPQTGKPTFYQIQRDIVPKQITFEVIERKIEIGAAFAFGSGADEFVKMDRVLKSENKSVAVFDVFERTLLSQQERTVSDLPQMVICSASELKFATFLAPQRDNPNSEIVSQFLNGIDLSAVGKVGNFGIAHEVRSFGMQTITANKVLAAKGINPEKTQVTKEQMALASLEAAIQYLEVPSLKTKSVRIDEQCSVQAVKPIFTNWYVVADCPVCTKTTPLCEDRSKGQFVQPLHGNGSIKTRCFHCDSAIDISPNSATSKRWSIPSR